MSEIIYTPSDFVAILNQTLDYAYPVVTIEGELANVRVSRGKWVYFDIKDDSSSVKCFGMVYMLPGPIEEGMMVRITASPRLHPLYNFSLNLQSMVPIGEGSLKRAADLLFAKLQKEGLFDPARKRSIPFAPQTVGLITSKESAAYADFNKILNERWGGVHIVHHDVQVQGERAIVDIVEALQTMNQLAVPPEVVIITRGGGSADDLAAFSNEQVVRAVATSRIPTLVAIGHEVDTSLAELAADVRASTPSNAAQLLTPDKREVTARLHTQKQTLQDSLQVILQNMKQYTSHTKELFKQTVTSAFQLARHNLNQQRSLLAALDPQAALKRGYAVLRSNGQVVTSIKSLQLASSLEIQLYDGSAEASITSIKKTK